MKPLVNNEAFAAAASDGPLEDVLDYSEEPLVSSDIVGTAASCTLDSGLTMAQGSLVKVVGWYDNEWGYSNRVVDLMAYAHKLKGGARKKATKKKAARR